MEKINLDKNQLKEIKNEIYIILMNKSVQKDKETSNQIFKIKWEQST